jgi:hypothetical protein
LGLAGRGEAVQIPTETARRMEKLRIVEGMLTAHAVDELIPGVRVLDVKEYYKVDAGVERDMSSRGAATSPPSERLVREAARVMSPHSSDKELDQNVASILDSYYADAPSSWDQRIAALRELEAFLDQRERGETTEGGSVSE